MRPKPEIEVIELSTSTLAISLLAAEHCGVEPGQIAKTLSFSAKDQTILIVTRGDTHVDNAEFKDQFGAKASPMLDAEDAFFAETSRPVGGVAKPFGLPSALPSTAMYR